MVSPSLRANIEDRYRILEVLPERGGSLGHLVKVRRRGVPEAEGRTLVLKAFDGAETDPKRNAQELRGLELARQVLPDEVADLQSGGGFFYYAMPFYEGPTLEHAALDEHERLGAGPPYLLLVLEWMRDLLSTLSDWHGKGIVHRDVKPQNIIVTRDGPRLVDLGLLTDITWEQTLSATGTHGYRDPELVELARAGVKVCEANAERFDIYSTGGVLYYLVCLEHPPDGVADDWPRGIPPVLREVHRRARCPHDRYGDAVEMREDLEYLREALAEGGRIEALATIPLPELPHHRPFLTTEGAGAAPTPDRRPAEVPTPRRPSRALVFLLLFVSLGAGWFLAPLLADRSGEESVVDPFAADLVSAFDGLRAELIETLRTTEPGLDSADLPVLVADSPLGRGRLGEILAGSGATLLPDDERTKAVRRRVSNGTDMAPGKVRELLVEEMPEGTIPIVVFLNPLGESADRRRVEYELRCVYGPFDRAQVLSSPKLESHRRDSE